MGQPPPDRGRTRARLSIRGRRALVNPPRACAYARALGKAISRVILLRCVTVCQLWRGYAWVQTVATFRRQMALGGAISSNRVCVYARVCVLVIVSVCVFVFVGINNIPY